MLFFKNQTMTVTMLLAVLPSILFLECGILLKYWLLIAFAIIFTISHILITYINAKADLQ